MSVKTKTLGCAAPFFYVVGCLFFAFCSQGRLLPFGGSESLFPFHLYLIGIPGLTVTCPDVPDLVSLLVARHRIALREEIPP